MQDDGRTQRLGWLVVGVLVLGMFATLAWRNRLPGNRTLVGHDFKRVTSDGVGSNIPAGELDYDDAVTVVTAHNFARDGFWRTHLLPNRRRHPMASIADLTQTQCASRDPPRDVLMYWNYLGQQVPARSLNNDCVYTHYPPLADWLFGGLASVGFDRLLHYRLVAIAFNCLTLLMLYAWLRREVGVLAALAAVLCTATLPAFLRWSDSLFYHSMQFLLLFAGFYTWQSHWRAPRRWSYLLTWLLYLFAAFTSYELTLFFAVFVGGTWLLEHHAREHRVRCTSVILLGLAPVTAFTLHLLLIGSYLGWGQTWSNLQATFFARVTQSVQGESRLYFQSVGDTLFPWLGVPAACPIIPLARLSAGLSWRRSGALLGILLLGGVSFFLVFHGSATEHFWMMSRHLLPFTVLLLALLVQSLQLCVSCVVCGARPGVRLRRARLWALLCTAGACALLGIVAFRNVRYVGWQVEWTRMKNRHPPAEDELVQTALHVVYWNQGPPRLRGVPVTPVAGVRHREPRGWAIDPRMIGPEPGHYEIWWLERVTVRELRLLLDVDEIGEGRDHCVLSAFDERDFQRVAGVEETSVLPYLTGTSEPSLDRAWLRFLLPRAVQTRALRLSCAGQDSIALRRFEAYADSR